MKKALIGFFIGLFIVVVVFCVVTLILANQHDVTFIQEISSWFQAVEDTTEPVVETIAKINVIG